MGVIRISEDTALTAQRALVQLECLPGLTEDDRQALRTAQGELCREWQRLHPKPAAVKPVIRRGLPRWRRILRRIGELFTLCMLVYLCWEFAKLAVETWR